MSNQAFRGATKFITPLIVKTQNTKNHKSHCHSTRGPQCLSTLITTQTPQGSSIRRADGVQLKLSRGPLLRDQRWVQTLGMKIIKRGEKKRSKRNSWVGLSLF